MPRKLYRDPATGDYVPLDEGDTQTVIDQGLEPTTQDEADLWWKQQKYGPQMGRAAAENALRSLTFGAVPGFGPEEDIRGRQQILSREHGVLDTASGLAPDVAAALLTGGLSGVATGAGRAAVRAAGKSVLKRELAALGAESVAQAAMHEANDAYVQNREFSPTALLVDTAANFALGSLAIGGVHAAGKARHWLSEADELSGAGKHSVPGMDTLDAPTADVARSAIKDMDDARFSGAVVELGESAKDIRRVASVHVQDTLGALDSQADDVIESAVAEANEKLGVAQALSEVDQPAALTQAKEVADSYGTLKKPLDELRKGLRKAAGKNPQQTQAFLAKEPEFRAKFDKQFESVTQKLDAIDALREKHGLDPDAGLVSVRESIQSLRDDLDFATTLKVAQNKAPALRKKIRGRERAREQAAELGAGTAAMTAVTGLPIPIKIPGLSWAAGKVAKKVAGKFIKKSPGLTPGTPIAEQVSRAFKRYAKGSHVTDPDFVANRGELSKRLLNEHASASPAEAAGVGSPAPPAPPGVGSPAPPAPPANDVAAAAPAPETGLPQGMHSKSGRAGERWKGSPRRAAAIDRKIAEHADDPEFRALVEEEAAINRVTPFGPGQERRLWELQKDVLEANPGKFGAIVAAGGTGAGVMGYGELADAAEVDPDEYATMSAVNRVTSSLEGRLDDAASRMVDPETSRPAIHRAAAKDGHSVAMARLMEDRDDSPEALVERHREALDERASNPAGLFDALSEGWGALPTMDPQTYAAVTSQAARVQAYLAEHVPRPSGQTVVRPEGFPATHEEIRTYAARAQGALKPMTVVEDMETGNAHPLAVQSLKRNWPDLFARVQIGALSEVRMAVDSGKAIPQWKRLQLERDLDLGDMLGIMHSGKLSAILDEGRPAEPKQQGDPLGGSRLSEGLTPNALQSLRG